MKKFAVPMALGAILISTAAQAADQRPTYIAFTPAATKPTTQAAPATPSVLKRKALAPAIILPALLGLAAAGAGLALVVKNSDDNVSPQ